MYNFPTDSDFYILPIKFKYGFTEAVMSLSIEQTNTPLLKELAFGFLLDFRSISRQQFTLKMR